MAITDRDRRNIYIKLADSIGEEEANNLMQLLPAQPYNDLATHDDVLSMAATLKGEMAELRAELRGEMAELRAELRGEMAELRADVNTQIAGLQRWAAGILAANGVALAAALLT